MCPSCPEVEFGEALVVSTGYSYRAGPAASDDANLTLYLRRTTRCISRYTESDPREGGAMIADAAAVIFLQASIAANPVISAKEDAPHFR